MKAKSVLVIILLNFLVISSLFATPKIKYYEPDYDNEAKLLEWCRQYADILGYDRALIHEAHFITLPNNILGRQSIINGKNIILVNKNYSFRSRYDFDENLVHEVCHIYTNSDLEWHIAMVKAASIIEYLKYEILEDEKTDHPLD